MGVINQSTGAFSEVVGALSTIVNGFDTISPYAANIERLSRFYQAMAEADTHKQQHWSKQQRLQYLLRVAPRDNMPYGPSAYSNMFHDNELNDAHSTLDIEMSNVGSNGTQGEESASKNRRNASCQDGKIELQQCSDLNVVLEIANVTLKSPDMKRTLIHNLDAIVEQGHHLLIVGPSGVGKSSLLRAIAGLWTTGGGTIYRPVESDIIFLPQKPYCTMGSLRDQLLYPSEYLSSTKLDGPSHDVMDWSFRSVQCDDSATYLSDSHPLLEENSQLNVGAIHDDELIAVLARVNLLDIAIRVGDGNPKKGLNTSMDWSNVLSMGEQQRLAFGRLLVHPPKRLVILDEATSALDMENEMLMYKILQDMATSAYDNDSDAAGLTYVSVGHRLSLEAFHKMRLRIGGNESGHEMTLLNE
jgi:ABC-type uncharacterized transport system fused permease/ATPase subunit